MTLSLSHVTLVINPIAREAMEESTVYLDGAVQGTVIDLERRSFSFDHHGEGMRFDRMCSAMQAVGAILQGLPLEEITQVVVSSVDADSVLATLSVLHPEVCLDQRFVRLVQDLNRVDAWGPGALVPGEPLQGFHFSLRQGRGEELSTELLHSKVEKAWAMYQDGSLFEEGVERKLPGRAVALSPSGGVLSDITREGDEEGVSFEEVYSVSGFGILFGYEGAVERGVVKVTIGKKPFVRVPDLQGFWAHMNEFEPGWGGADSIGGSPFKKGTRFSHEEVLQHLRDWLGS
jgi:hypothetical protein